MKRRMRKEVKVMTMTSRSPSERSRTRLPVTVALATGDFPPYPAPMPWHLGVRHLYLLWFILISIFASSPRSAEALSQTKKVDLDTIPQINGVSMLELDFEGLADKPWRLPGMYKCTCMYTLHSMLIHASNGEFMKLHQAQFFPCCIEQYFVLGCARMLVCRNCTGGGRGKIISRRQIPLYMKPCYSMFTLKRPQEKLE